MHSWISYKRRRNDGEIRESYRIAQQYPLVEPKAAEINTQQDCETSRCEAKACLESENSPIDSAPSSAPSSPANSVSVDISTPDDCIPTIFPIRLKNEIWGLTPAFSPIKGACTEDNIHYAQHFSFSNVKGAIADASSALLDSSSDSLHCQHVMPTLRI